MVALLLAFTGTAHADLTVTFNTTSNGGQYAPANVVAAWIEVDGGPMVKTMAVHAQMYRVHLIAHGLISPNDMDVVSGASRLDHLTPVMFTWNLRGRDNKLVPDGRYRIRMEMADDNSVTTADNRQGAFLFTVGPMPEMQIDQSSGGFVNGTVDFAPVLCENGVVDPGETCDTAIAGSCPTTCGSSGDSCAPNNLVGDALSCTAACQVEPIVNCVGDDGCCAPGCTEADDNDCEGVDINNVGGGCDAGNGSSVLVFAALGLGALFVRRRRRA